jgi:hypothetical protein
MKEFNENQPKHLCINQMALQNFHQECYFITIICTFVGHILNISEFYNKLSCLCVCMCVCVW